MKLQHCTWPDVEAYLDRSNGIVVPIGSIEQHGPIGLIGTDAIVPAAIADAASDTGDFLVGPDIALGAAQFNLGFPGTVSTRPTTLIALIVDYVRSLAGQGFRKIYFLNGHGANIAVARAAFQEIHAAVSFGDADAAPVDLKIRSWWELPAVAALRDELYGAQEGMHATPSEIALTQHILPGSARDGAETPPDPLSPDFLLDHAGDQHPDAPRHRRRFPDGRVGSHSALASETDGKRLFEAAVADLIVDYGAFLKGD